MKYRLLTLLAVALAIPAAWAQTSLPAEIKDGNILHCFDWKLTDIRKELPNIAEAGFVAVQTSPMQRNVSSGWNWSEAYRPADFAFSPSGLGTKNDLINLCTEAEKYGIQVIVDVVFNHVDSGSYHVAWWDNSGRLRSTTNFCNYNDRYSVTHDRMVNCPEVNTEHAEVISRAKSYIEELKECGVKGIRFDGAKHIGLPSEGSDFWKVVTSVPDMFYYGELLDNPGGSNYNGLMVEYTDYMYVTDNGYSDKARRAAGVPTSEYGWATSVLDPEKCVYWGESHDTYSNASGASKNTSQGVIDRAYAIVACRQKGVALYFSRPSKTAYGDIKIGQKGSTHFIDAEVAEVNKFKNEMVGKEAAFTQNGNEAVVTRKDGGAVVVKKTGAGSINIDNAKSYCPEGVYYDRISGNPFTVTSSKITGTTGSTGIAVLYGDYDPSGVEGIFDDYEESGEPVWYSIQGVQVDSPTQPGIYIYRYTDGKSGKVVIR